MKFKNAKKLKLIFKKIICTNYTEDVLKQQPQLQLHRN